MEQKKARSRTRTRTIKEWKSRGARPSAEPRAPYDYNAVLSCSPVSNCESVYRGKEQIDSLAYVCRGHTGNRGNKLCTPIRVRWYMGRSRSATRVFCALWAFPPYGSKYGQAQDGEPQNENRWLSGCSGQSEAGGYGYHKQSASLNGAIRSAGFSLLSDFGGCGDRAIEAAILAIADYMGLPLDGLIVRS